MPRQDARLALAQLALALHLVAVHGLGIRKQRGSCTAVNAKTLVLAKIKAMVHGLSSAPHGAEGVGLVMAPFRGSGDMVFCGSMPQKITLYVATCGHRAQKASLGWLFNWHLFIHPLL